MNIDIDIIKNFYKNILPLQCFKSIYLDIYGKDSYYPFENREFTNSFIENNFEILPVFNTLGLTDKFTTKTYFIPFVDKIHNDNNNFENKYINNIIKKGVFIRTGNHEIGHIFTNIKFYSENCQTSIETPRKKSLDFVDWGYYIDLALYGKKLDKINLEQALYLLNEKNYEKNYIEFQYDINNIKQEDLIVEGEFKEICEDIINKLNNIDFKEKSKEIYINLESSSIKEKSIYCGIKNDVLGKKMKDETYKRILEKYG